MSAAGWYLRNISSYCLSYYCSSILVLTAEQTPRGHQCTPGALVAWLQKWMDLSTQSTKPEHCHHPSFSIEYAQRILLRTEYFNITIQTLSWLTGNLESAFLSWVFCVPPPTLHTSLQCPSQQRRCRRCRMSTAVCKSSIFLVRLRVSGDGFS